MTFLCLSQLATSPLLKLLWEDILLSDVGTGNPLPKNSRGE